MPTKDAIDTELDRQQMVDELVADIGPLWAEPYKLGSLGCHELLDRAFLVSDLVDRHLLNHPACVQNPQWFALADVAANALNELYQLIGAEHLGADSEGKTAVPADSDDCQTG